MANYPSDLEIANAAFKKPIHEIADKLDIDDKSLIRFGDDKAKLNSDFLNSLSNKDDGKLILVTAISPTPAGEGKTTTSVGLVDGLCNIGKKAMICLREPSLGPCFGMKGGAAGGGYSQVIQNSPPEFAKASLEIYGLDVNASPPPLPKLVYNSHEQINLRIILLNLVGYVIPTTTCVLKII